LVAKLQYGSNATNLYVSQVQFFNTLWMDDADLRLYITTVQDG